MTPGALRLDAGLEDIRVEADDEERGDYADDADGRDGANLVADGFSAQLRFGDREAEAHEDADGEAKEPWRELHGGSRGSGMGDWIFFSALPCRASECGTMATRPAAAVRIQIILQLMGWVMAVPVSCETCENVLEAA